MKAQFIGMGIVFLVFISLVDLYSYRGVSRLSGSLSSNWETGIRILFFALSLAAVLLILKLMFFSAKVDYERLSTFMKRSMGYLILIYVPKLFFISFLLIRDIFLAGGRVFASFSSSTDSGESLISRGNFILRLGLILAVIPFLSIVYGIWKGKYNYTVRKIRLNFPNFPEVFNGLKIAQISDLHLGSFENDPSKISEAIQLINKENPDIIVFTGDLVNNLASEAKAFVNELAKLKAKDLKLSILGNHDYGTYYQWESESDLRDNMEELYRYHKESGFSLLRNDAVELEKEGEKISLLGVENWGEPPFPQYGDLKLALEKAGNSKFKILLSHDPSHWDAKVLPESDVDLTLSGHTHGMQFAINIPGWKWSPVKFKYPRWSGLYREAKQYLYVNIGLGFIGFPGRVGTPPEISVFELFNGRHEDNKVSDY